MAADLATPGAGRPAGSPAVARASRFDGHRLSEFVYGTVTGLVSVAGLDAGHDTSWVRAAAIVVVGAVAIWFAHAYSQLMSRRVASGVRLGRSEVQRTLRESWPIVTAGLVLAAPFALSGLGIIGMGAAFTTSSVVGLAILAVVGLLAGAVTHETWPRRLLLAAGSAGMGLLVVLVELAVRH